MEWAEPAATLPILMPTSSTALEPLLTTVVQSSGIRNPDRVRNALAFAERHYANRMHVSGVTLTEHVAGVLELLLPFRPDDDAVIGCLFHHLLELRALSLGELEQQWGARVRSLVSGAHLLSHVTKRDRRMSIEDLRLILLRVSDDVRVLLIILCDQCYLLERINGLPPEKKRIAQDVLSLFAPVAARLGIHTLKQRLEGLAFPLIYPNDAAHITDQLRLVHERYHDFLPQAAAHLQQELRALGIDTQVDGREKHAYSIFVKMKQKSLSQIDQLHDLFALRVIVPSVEECYRALGFLHQLGRPVANRFKDYIAFPKPNGYQSLHTTMTRLPATPEGLFLEVQIRTPDMHRDAEYGIAAHWNYKEGGTAEQGLQRIQLHQVLTTQQSVELPGARGSLADHIFVLTPKGDIVELPEGATPLDFAFQIHTDLGLRFRAARVNGRIVPLNEKLENGDMVEVMTQSTPRPSEEWIQHLTMASSRARLKRYFHSLNRDLYVNRGRMLLSQELEKRGLPPLDPDLSVLRQVDGRVLTLEDREDVLMKVGQGSERASAVLQHIDVQEVVRLRRRKIPSNSRLPARTIGSSGSGGQRKGALVELEGGFPMPIRFAKCCKAQEKQGEPILGCITRSGEVVIHVKGCRMVKKGNPERRVRVKWTSP
ncbi:MAG: GTP pyrophosphokinase [Candidatus Peregrinibacteria bacterium Greene0416_19]|nr:MAG: GTP pyrophosphokinase [Candidatus Peregrinibacteria bacterium Greene0416_19]